MLVAPIFLDHGSNGLEGGKVEVQISVVHSVNHVQRYMLVQNLRGHSPVGMQIIRTVLENESESLIPYLHKNRYSRKIDTRFYFRTLVCNTL